MAQYHLHTQARLSQEEYTTEMQKWLRWQCVPSMKCLSMPIRKKDFTSFKQSYGSMKCLKKSGLRGWETAHKEMQQLHDRVVFESIMARVLADLEKRRAMEKLIFLVEKRDQSVKFRTCSNGCFLANWAWKTMRDGKTNFLGWKERQEYKKQDLCQWRLSMRIHGER